ncbi:sigma-70 family RNA polymerase sigma factor [Salinibacillus xinjiangensis]|uniref:RNA polymerase sigma factor n=1 Tax=Salinibacillus xinjiangensis TaxID=1229268 RepID=A0A6G1X411_9BACI|nr:sigma-70 family RNA polymerase sigma factor [Salinibacillus xinjiangensis]MRG85645.1 sigma-70 family RNA polymerase sigma factor [Salinibacillus xinjiangensis]
MTNQDQLHDLMGSMRDSKKKFDELIEPHRSALWNYCKMITCSPWDAEDLVQETLLKAYSALPRIFQPMIPKSYLFRIATNTWLNQQRRVEPVYAEEIGYEEPVLVQDPLETREAMAHLIIHLSPKQRVAILLFDVFRFKAKEVAEMLNTTEGGVKSCLRRARINLKKIDDKSLHPSTKPDESKVATPKIIDAYLDAFNRREPDAIAQLLDNEAENDIVNTSFEYGKETIRKHSLEGWARDPMPMVASYIELWGKPIVVVKTKVDGVEHVYDLIELQIVDDKITQKRDFYFCQDLLDEAAKELDLPVHKNGYIYQG